MFRHSTPPPAAGRRRRPPAGCWRRCGRPPAAGCWPRAGRPPAAYRLGSDGPMGHHGSPGTIICVKEPRNNHLRRHAACHRRPPTQMQRRWTWRLGNILGITLKSFRSIWGNLGAILKIIWSIMWRFLDGFGTGWGRRIYLLVVPFCAYKSIFPEVYF